MSILVAFLLLLNILSKLLLYTNNLGPMLAVSLQISRREVLGEEDFLGSGTPG